jgi:Leucine-rich repeat (LRR) protein
MSCNSTSNTIGVAIEYSPGLVAVAHHGLPTVFPERRNFYRYDTINAVIAGLADRTTPAEIRSELLRNLAMNKVSLRQIRNLSTSERTHYRWLQGVQNILAVAEYAPQTDPAAIRGLDLSQKNLKSVVGIGAFTGLTELILSGNRLTDIPSEIAQLTELQQLSLSGNALTVFPPELARLPKLVNLELGGNDLKELPDDVGSMGSLWMLSAQNNKICVVSPKIANLRWLRHLDLSGNSIATINLGEHPDLQFLNLRGNGRLTQLPDGATMENLTELDLSGNGFEEIPPIVGQLKKLQWLRLSGNKITEIPDDLNLGKLAQLDLSQNLVPSDKIPTWLKKMRGKASYEQRQDGLL